MSDAAPNPVPSAPACTALRHLRRLDAPPGRCSDLRCHRIEAVQIAGREQQVGAGLGQTGGDGMTDAAGSAGDESGAARQQIGGKHASRKRRSWNERRQ